MRRREFITMLGGAAAAWPLMAHAQQGARVRRIGVFIPAAETDSGARANLTSFQRALERFGWFEGGNLQIEYRWVADRDRADGTAAELVATRPDVILTASGFMVSALKRQTRIVPEAVEIGAAGAIG
jgi:putative ABC transport system substrate-binding protein